MGYKFRFQNQELESQEDGGQKYKFRFQNQEVESQDDGGHGYKFRFQNQEVESQEGKKLEEGSQSRTKVKRSLGLRVKCYGVQKFIEKNWDQKSRDYLII